MPSAPTLWCGRLLSPSYKWGFYKTLEFLDSRRPDLEIRRSFFEQLKFLAERLAATEKVSESWDHIASQHPDVRNEEIVLRNTFFNSKLEDMDKSMLDGDKKKASKLKKKKQSPVPDKKRRRLKWVDETSKAKTVETEVFVSSNKGMKLKFDLGMSAPRSILKGSLRKQDKAYSQDQRRADWKSNLKQQDSSLSHKGEVTSLKNEPNSVSRKKDGLLIQPQRPKSSSYHNDLSSDDSELDSVAKASADFKTGNRRLLYTGEKNLDMEPGSQTKSPMALSISNSFKRLDSAKTKKGETPRMKEPSDKDKRKAIEPTSKHREEASLQQNYIKPPAAKKSFDTTKKPNIDTTIERLRRENNYLFKHDTLPRDSGPRENGDLQSSAKKKNNKSEIEEKEHLNGNLSKNR